MLVLTGTPQGSVLCIPPIRYIINYIDKVETKLRNLHDVASFKLMDIVHTSRLERVDMRILCKADTPWDVCTRWAGAMGDSELSEQKSGKGSIESDKRTIAVKIARTDGD
ncbi:hypothetical protein Zmor_008513 [Zophobas morio]|uniref:Uncharacterized protein n=1 Tax=Zophobas morio TaxID=2755281 RepID=A0AA38J348_9CUCU|nr:hypothetical protein Zmor_008513 [Zophobas morio]